MELSFNEDEFVPRNVPEWMKMAKRGEFVGYVHQYIEPYLAGNNQVQRFSLSLSRPHEHGPYVDQFIHFAVSRGAKHLELEFYHHIRDQDHVIDPAQGYPLPDVVYDHHQTLQTLKLVWCNIKFYRFPYLRSLDTLTLAWIPITTSQLRGLVAFCPVLNTLTLRCCVGLDALRINVLDHYPLKNLVVEMCNLDENRVRLDGVKLRKFIYTGKVARFRMRNQSELIEARLDFTWQLEFVTGPSLCRLLDQLVNARILSVCSVFLQMIPSGGRPYRTDSDLNVQHLTMNTGLHVNEFIGIKFMLASCPRMNTLTLCLRPGKIFANYMAPYQMTTPTNFWCEPVEVPPCLRESLLVLNVHGFQGTYDQMMVVDYIINYGDCLRSVNLYLPQAFDDNLMAFVLGKASQLRGANRGGLEILVLTPLQLVSRID